MKTPDTVTIAPDTIEHVRASWKAIAPQVPRLSRLFYDHLFSADPSLIPLFTSNQLGEMAQQGEKLMQMLGYAVEDLDDLEALAPVLLNLGRRHAGYGVEEAHYPTVEAALLQTLAEGLGDGFTPAVRKAWTSAYEVMATIMVAGARAALPPKR